MNEMTKMNMLKALAFNGIEAARIVATAKEYQLVDYSDVWADECGWQVNDISRTDEFITITDDATDEELFEYLRDTIGYFVKECKFEEIRFEWSDDYICEFFEAATYMPLGRLELSIRR